MHAARRLWTTLEPLHAVIYFAPEARESGVALGLRGFWSTYFAYRAAPLGPVGAGAVVATFASFEPAMVAKALPDAWSRTTPAACLERRATVSASVLRAVGVSSAACAAAVERLAPVVAAADATGRALFGANAEVPLPEDPVAALWQLATSLREHRGDGHVAALVSAELTGLAALLMQAAAGRVPEERMRVVRGWSESSWAAARAELESRGLLAGGGLTDTGTALLASVEEHTDVMAWQGAVAALGESGVAEVVDLLKPSVDAVWASGLLPELNPIGVPRV